MKNIKFKIYAIILIFPLITSCASLTARYSEPNHRPGTFYPGIQKYYSALTDKSKSSNHEAYLLKDPGFLIFVGFLVPFIVVDLVAVTPIYDTVALPWDTVRRLKRDDTIEINFEENKANLIQNKLVNSQSKYKGDITTFKKDSEIMMIEYDYSITGVQIIRSFYYSDRHLSLVIQKSWIIDEAEDSKNVFRFYFKENQLIKVEGNLSYPESVANELLKQSAIFYELAEKNDPNF